MQTNLKKGTELTSLSFTENSESCTIALGVNNVTALIVVMENGILAEAPWVEVYVSEKLTHQVNCQNISSVSFK